VPNPRVELPYTYFVARYVMHCPSLYVLYQQNHSERLQLPASRCFPDIQDTSYGDCFLDFTGPDRFTTLSTGVFYWLINFRPEYLIFRQGDTCTIKPYGPSQFTRQFGYDQLYMGNPNIGLRFNGNLFEGTQTWYFHMAGGTG